MADTFMLEFSALELLRELVRKHGHAMTMLIWEYAEDRAIEAGEDCISYERLEQSVREYYGRPSR